MTMPDFSPALDAASIEQAAADYRETGIAQIKAPLTTDAAKALLDHFANDLQWSLVFNEGAKIWDIPPENIEPMWTSASGPGLRQAIYNSAQKGFQYEHEAVRVSDDADERTERGWMVDALLESLNGPEWLPVLRTVTGEAAADLVDGQATRYRNGHFLTGHDDDVPGKNRFGAYVLGLTPQWRTEWGGLLQFHDEYGDVERGIMPKFNVMNIFRVPRYHSVAPVSPFAGGPRYSFTGWIRQKG